MKILISGSTGLIGSALTAALQAAGHEITRLTRPGNKTMGGLASDAAIEWRPERGLLDHARVEGFDAAIHLAGENIAGRWTPEKKEAIRDSRVQSTRLLCETLARLERPPHTLLCASASGIYGGRGDEPLSEESAHGKGFLADVCRQWEASTDPASSRGIRVVNMRFAMVLSARGGALAQMLTPFRFGLGGPLGGGRQFMSWVTLDDVVRAALHLLATESLKGPVNIASPHPLRNSDFTRLLALALHRPALLPVPAFALRLLYGDLADEVLLASQRLVPEHLQNSGFQFEYPDLRGALRHLLQQ